MFPLTISRFYLQTRTDLMGIGTASGERSNFLFDRNYARLYNCNMDHKQTTIKVWVETRSLLRLIAALTGESMVSVSHRLARAELSKVDRSGAIPELDEKIAR